MPYVNAASGRGTEGRGEEQRQPGEREQTATAGAITRPF